ncbi:MAG: amidohydrolase family protein [Candidatus Omnitrophica bacterium]|nr:amidohydrolase family protein [Candidatus Omnitrophota bacterium]
MPREKLVDELIEESGNIPIVDCHQHLMAETPLTTDLVRVIVMDNYVSGDLVAAGLSPDSLDWLKNIKIPLKARWAKLFPFWEKVRYGGYARAILITINHLYGGFDLKEEGQVQRVSVRLAEDYAQPGLFCRLFFNHCHIDTVLTQGSNFSYDRPRFYWVFRPLDRADFSPGGLFEQDCAKLGIRLKSGDDLPAAMEAILRSAVKQGAIGFKAVAMNWSWPNQEEIRSAWQQRKTKQATVRSVFLRLYLARIAAIAAESGVPVAVHTGAPWTNWLDYRQWEPTGLIPLFCSFPETRFDLYHAGLPYIDQASLLAKTFPNVWHNLTWTHIISPEMAQRCMANWLDIVPINKVLGFGGDYMNETVVLTYGHLRIARENISRVLASRMKKNLIGKDEAREIIRLWFSENPRELYRLKKD